MTRNKSSSKKDTVDRKASTSSSLLSCVTLCPKTSRARIAIRAKPGAKVSCLAAIDEEGALNVQLNAPARDGEANEELIAFLSKEVLAVKKKDVALIQDNSGELDIDEFTQMFPGEDAALVRRMFDLFDTDGSGTIELKEFVIGLSSLSSVSTVDKVKFAFNLYDLDNSGFLDYGELLQLLTAAQAGMGKIKNSDVRSRAEEVYASLGISSKEDSSGDDDVYPPLSYEQFVSIARERPQLLLPAHALTQSAVSQKRAH